MRAIDAARTAQLALLAGFAFALNAGCSRQEPASPQDSWSLESPDAIRAEVTAGGIATSYTAHFVAGELQRITEIRKSADGQRAGEYIFKGARLIQYRGQTIEGDADAELVFNMQGALTSGTGLSQEAVAAISNRAQLLRSLALARRASRGHGS
jgi:hypothetical protein